VINLFNVFRRYKSPLFANFIRIHLISLSCIIFYSLFAISLYFYGENVNVNINDYVFCPVTGRLIRTLSVRRQFDLKMAEQECCRPTNDDDGPSTYR